MTRKYKDFPFKIKVDCVSWSLGCLDKDRPKPPPDFLHTLSVHTGWHDGLFIELEDILDEPWEYGVYLCDIGRAIVDAMAEGLGLDEAGRKQYRQELMQGFNDGGSFYPASEKEKAEAA